MNPPRLLDQIRDALRSRRYSPRTEAAYVEWSRRFILFHNKKHPIGMGESEINAFISSLALKDRVSASTQNQALCALMFLYKRVLRQDFPWMNHVVRAKRTRRLPVVLSRSLEGHLDVSLEHRFMAVMTTALPLVSVGVR